MKEVAKGIYYIGVNDYKTDLFEGLWPLPEGVSYNSYIVKGKEKTAIIETVKNLFVNEFLSNIEEITPFESIDYIVLNHLEPDHTSSLLKLLEKIPNAQIYCSNKAINMLESLYKITDNVHSAKEGDSLDLGDKKLVFYMDPLVHWPETMVTYEEKEGVLFSCDAFGSFKTLETGIFDDEVDIESYRDETIRYFSNIVGKYTKYVLQAIEKLSDLDIKIVAPAHGLLWRKDPKKIIDLYVQLSQMKGEQSVVIIWGSMYGNTKKVVNHVAQGIKEEGLSVTILDVVRDHLSYQLKETWKHKGVILGFPTYDGAEFLPISYYLHIMKRKNIHNRIVGFFGSSLWSGRALKKAADKLVDLDWTIIEPLLEFRGAATKEILTQAKELGRNVAQKVKESFT